MRLWFPYEGPLTFKNFSLRWSELRRAFAEFLFGS